MVLDPPVEEDIADLIRLGEEAKRVRYLPEGKRVQLKRDAIVYRLANAGVSATRIAHVAGIHRVLVYRIKDNYPGRLARWQAAHPGEEL